jgi:UDP-N-acetylglucosamine:LPS N-acetylglucosamine transferase
VRLALVSSVGGHLTDLLELSRAFDDWSRFWIVNDYSPVLPENERSYRISHAERDWRVLWNIAEVAAIFAREKPQMMLSTGAGLAISAAVVARAAGIPVIYVEPSSAVTHLTLTGRLMRPLANRFYVQWPSMLKAAPWAKYDGGLF